MNAAGDGTPQSGRNLSPTEAMFDAESRWVRLVRPLQQAAERTGKDWLIYNPLKMYQFHAFAARDSAAVTRSFRRVFPEARSYADIGAGSGAHAAELKRQGFEVVACEHSPVGRFFARRQGVDSVPFELADDPPAVLPNAVDVAFSFEVAEHIPPALSENMVRFMAQLAPTVAFTAARPGQRGTGHINLRSPEEWASLFAAAGAPKDEAASEQIQTAFQEEGVWAQWLINNIQVFKRA